MMDQDDDEEEASGTDHCGWIFVMLAEPMIGFKRDSQTQSREPT